MKVPEMRQKAVFLRFTPKLQSGVGNTTKKKKMKQYGNQICSMMVL